MRMMSVTIQSALARRCIVTMNHNYFMSFGING